jgi:hypothetical protein
MASLAHFLTTPAMSETGPGRSWTFPIQGQGAATPLTPEQKAKQAEAIRLGTRSEGDPGSNPEAWYEALKAAAVTTARKLTDATPEEIELLDWILPQLKEADQGVINEMSALSQRGQDLDKLDVGYFERGFGPAYERLLQRYDDMDRGILEDMNKRGIVSQVGAGSEPEAYQRMLLSRDTKQEAGRIATEWQNNAVQQKLGQYNARLAEANQANIRRSQTFDPYYAAKVTPEAERMQARAGTAANLYGTRLGTATQMHQINSARQMAGQDRLMSMLGAGGQAGGSAIGGMAMAGMFSDPEMKEGIEEGPTPEESLGDLDDLDVKRWRYKMGGGEHEGAMATEMPEDMTDGQTVDVPTYLGKITGAIQALNTKMGRFEQMLAQGGV